MLTWTKYQLDRRRLRQARKAIPAVTCWLPLGYCRNLGELVPVKGGIISSSLSLIEGNQILPITPRDGCANWCSLLETAQTVPYNLICLELGIEPLRYIIMRRRLIYLQHILKQNESSLIKQFLKTQMKTLKKKDWGKTVKEDLIHLGL